MELLSRRQLEAIGNLGNTRWRIHVGPYGCGKSYALAEGFGIKLMNEKPGRLGYLIVGKTAQLAKSNVGDMLIELFGDNYKETSSKEDDKKSKDALLFGHRLYYGGMNDTTSIKRVLGKSYRGILADEVTSFTEEHYKLLQGRLRGEPPHWFEGSTNPDGPNHWLYKMLAENTENNGPIELIQWTKEDNICSWADDYYANLCKSYPVGSPYYEKYVLGHWSAAGDLVYGDTFVPKEHVLDDAELFGAQYKYYKIGIDYGVENPTVALLVGVMPGGEHIIIKELYLPHAKDLDQIMLKIISMVNNVPGKLVGIWYDPSASVLKKGLNSKGLHSLKQADNDVINGIALVNSFIAQGKLYVAKSCENTINEFMSYSYSKKDGEVVKKEHDHCMDALRYLIYSDRNSI